MPGCLGWSTPWWVSASAGGAPDLVRSGADSKLQTRCVRLIENLGLGHARSIVSINPLSGGVSCDIAAVDLGARRICVKFALPKLRVAADWYAPASRNKAEYEWLAFARTVVPSAVPELLGRDADTNGFAMEFIAPEDAYLWKTALLYRSPSQGEGGQVGRALGSIHAASSRDNFVADAFQNQSDFHALRLEPYLEFTALKYPELAPYFNDLVASLKANSDVLIHGDISPKNIFFRGGHALILDAECATLGDACFDLAFCMNHLILKAFHMPDSSTPLLAELQCLWHAYARHVHWEASDALEQRTCQLLPALMLARVDGKSPVEYLDAPTRGRVRACLLLRSRSSRPGTSPTSLRSY